MFDKPLETMTDKELLNEQQELTQKIAEGGLLQHEINQKFASILTEALNRLEKKEDPPPTSSELDDQTRERALRVIKSRKPAGGIAQWIEQRSSKP